ncbi:exodeoxyribonuclease V subunit beta [Thermithiobacillus plumbiphilus]|uniref:RecBCD enzyme subunit RecB n=1 Tax=Thermithiobacillus plumbiphilus TaxID=1729899 RepID=A0ABU9D5N4_9PROT
MQALDPLAFPLAGTRLIEASAGTGKTYTIAALFLRFLLESGREIDQILVVTFTTAATQELRDRVRGRIREALTAFQAGTSEDTFLSALLEHLPDHELARQRLRNALTRMDEASIFTIHGFCQRTLASNAFESGAAFETELVQDELPYLQAVCEDFWRRRFYPLSAEWIALVQTIWKTPSSLLAAIRPYLRDENLLILPEPGDLDTPLDAYRNQVAVARTAWLDAQENIVSLLVDHGALKSGAGYSRENILAVAEGLQAFFTADDVPLMLPRDFELFTAEKLATALDKRKKLAVAPKHPFFDHCQALLACHGKLRLAFLVKLHAEALSYCREELARRKAQLRILCFDDLLGHLHQALHAEAGAALANRISSQYPVALIDEFQDTDPIQYGIFRRIYQSGEHLTLLMIGDPKQAIYSFRGADIFTYMQARRDVPAESGHYTLDTNWRASTRLIQAINSIFGAARAPFIHDADITFHPVKAGGKADESPLAIDGVPPVPLQCWFVERDAQNAPKGQISRDWAKEHLGQACASEILELLQAGAAGRARIGERPLSARDIAVLVRDRHEARAIQNALRDVRIASVFLSRDSVFDTEEAGELLRVLCAVLEPGREGLLRAALCTSLLGQDAQAMEACRSDDVVWETWLQRFQRYQRLWLERGVMAMCQHLIQEAQVVSRLLACVDGERRLTNLLHLMEVLASMSREQHGMAGLLRWYQTQCSAEGEGQEEWQLRLESDEDLVQIVTIHKSKGLEYPVVFLPFAWTARPGRKEAPLRFHDEAAGRSCLDLGSPDLEHHHALAERERLAEDLRLLYVALTRAKYLCYVSWGRFGGVEHSALGYLLHAPEDSGANPVTTLEQKVCDFSDEQLRAPLDRLADEHPDCIRVCPPPTASVTPWSPPVPEHHTLAARDFTARIDKSWRIGSYTSLIQGLQGQFERPDHDAQDAAGAAPVAAVADVYRFPRGAQAGSFLHFLLEKMDFPTARGPALQALIARGLTRFAFNPEWQPVVESWLDRVLDTPLDPEATLSLRQLDASRCLRELEFHFPVHSLDPASLTALLARQGIACRLSFEAFQGMMKGFVDLVFEHQGTFYLADYKSNHLGDRPEDYTPERLAGVMDAQSYTLQALIYSVALHRYLGQRIVDYDYDRHFGGVFYLFLRGMDPATGAGSGIYFNKPSRALVEMLDAFFAGSRMSTAEVACA